MVLQCSLHLRTIGGIGHRSEQRDDLPQLRERRVEAGISVPTRWPIAGLGADAKRPAQADATTIGVAHPCGGGFSTSGCSHPKIPFPYDWEPEC
jgi:hypothetical protein